MTQLNLDSQSENVLTDLLVEHWNYLDQLEYQNFGEVDVSIERVNIAWMLEQLSPETLETAQVRTRVRREHYGGESRESN